MAAAGVAGGVALGPWWQRLLSFLGGCGLAYFAWIFAVFEFANRTRPILESMGGDTALLERWGNRWMGRTLAALACVTAVGIWEIVAADGWTERIAVFFTVGGAVVVAGMGTIFCFCAIPQIRSTKPPQG